MIAESVSGQKIQETKQEELILGVLSKSLGRRKTLFPRGHVPFLNLVLKYFMLESDCSYATVVENTGRVLACFHLEGTFSRGILLFFPEIIPQ